MEAAAARQRGRDGAHGRAVNKRRKIHHFQLSLLQLYFVLCCNVFHLGQGDLNLVTIITMN